MHSSYDFYNNGTSYFNGGVVVDAGLSQTGGADVTFTGKVSIGGGDTSTAQVALKGQQSLLSFVRGTSGDAQFFMSSDSSRLYFSHTDIQSTNLILTLNQDKTATFAGDVSIEDNLYLTDSGTVRGKIQLNSSDRDDLDIKAVSLGSNMKFFTVDTERMRINSAGTLIVGGTTARSSSVPTRFSVQGGMSEFETTLTNNNDWENSPISILERANIGSGSSDDKYAPNLNFHWSGRVSNSLWMSDNGHLNWGSYTSAGVPAADGTFNAGNATFAGDVTVGDDVFIADSGVLNFGSGNDFFLFHDGADSVIRNSTGHVFLDNFASDKDIYFRGKDGTTTITALHLDMSNGGSATFVDDIDLGGKITQTGTGNNTFGGNVTLSSTAPILYLANTTSSTGKTWYFSTAANGNAYISQNGVIDAITLSHTSGNATFGGAISSGAITSTSAVTGTRLVANGTGNAIELNQSATGSATYYVMDNTVETGGKRYRFGYSGGSSDKGSFSIYNQTDSVMPLLLSGANATFAGDITAWPTTQRVIVK